MAREDDFENGQLVPTRDDLTLPQLTEILKAGYQSLIDAGSLPTVTWQGQFVLLGVTLKVYQLSDGSRIIDGPDFERFMAAMDDPNAGAIDQAELARFVSWRSVKAAF
jgi:hypothetical protein